MDPTPEQSESIRRATIIEKYQNTDLWPLLKLVSEDMSRQLLAVSQSIQQAHLSHGFAGQSKGVLDFFEYLNQLPVEKQRLTEELSKSARNEAANPPKPSKSRSVPSDI